MIRFLLALCALLCADLRAGPRAMATVSAEELAAQCEKLDDRDFFVRQEADDHIAGWIGEGRIDRAGLARMGRLADESRSFTVKRRLIILLHNAR